MYSKEAIKLVPDCNEALKELGVCQCEGDISTVLFAHNVEVCKKCNKPIKGWKWEPRWRDLIVTPTGIWMFDYEKEGDLWIRNNEQEESYIDKDDIGRNCFPILPRETLEEILEGLGYDIDIQKGSPRLSAQCRIYPSFRSGQIKGMDVHDYLKWKDKNTIITFGKDRQTAVMNGIIELVKKLAKGK